LLFSAIVDNLDVTLISLCKDCDKKWLLKLSIVICV
jgi:hypothetical protein